MNIYKIQVTREAIVSYDFAIEAKDEEDARQQAIDEAGRTCATDWCAIHHDWKPTELEVYIDKLHPLSY